MTFDEEYAKILGINTERVNQVLVLLTSLTVILGIKVVGTMLVSSLIIFPAITALQICQGFKKALFMAIFFALLSVVSGIVVAFVVNVPAGAAIVLVNFGFFLVASGIKQWL